MLSEARFPYTGPCFGPGKNQTLNYSTVKGLKRALIRLGFLDTELGEETDDYGAALDAAMRKYQRQERLTADGDYGRGEYLSLREEKVKSGPHKGEYALDSLALKYVREDVVSMCYPHPDVAGTYVGQGLHQTAGIAGNWAIDFMAHGGTPVLAPERCRVTRFSGHDPRLYPTGPGIWAWSVYFETVTGRRWTARSAV